MAVTSKLKEWEHESQYSVDQKLTCLGCKGAPEWGEREMILSFLGINKA